MTRATEEGQRGFGIVYSRFLLQMMGVAVLLGVGGYWPTIRLAGEEGLPSMMLGIVVSWVASLAGTVPIWWSRHKKPLEAMPYQLAAMALRLLVVLLLGTIIASGRWVDLKPFLLWLVIGHAGFLITDTQLARSTVLASAARENEGALEER